jgi:hypothetical protein
MRRLVHLSEEDVSQRRGLRLRSVAARVSPTGLKKAAVKDGSVKDEPTVDDSNDERHLSSSDDTHMTDEIERVSKEGSTNETSDVGILADRRLLWLRQG